MEIIFDPTFFLDLASRNPLEIMWILFVRGGWIIVAIMLIRLWWVMRLMRLQGKYAATIEYIMLAIDIPKDSEQTPKAMEQVFATISGAHSPLTKQDIYMKGVIQVGFSFEIISIDGYIQFLIRTPKFHRDLVEGAIYAHYPDAEITEVYDYTTGIPRTYPNDQYNVWGSELELVANAAYPIRTYESFEDKLTQELKDPVSGVIETMSRIQKGEQVWFQIIVIPTENAGWVNKHLAVAYKLAGKKKEVKSAGILQRLMTPLYNLVDSIPLFQVGGAAAKKEEGLDFRILNLTPGERASIEAIERKASKLGFICKLRLVYLAPHSIFSSKRVIPSVFGAFKQFGDLTSNGFKPNRRTKTQAAYFNVENRVNARRSKIVRNFISRSWYSGSKYFILNTEELATIYHFPALTIVNPLLKRTDAKKSDAPVQLPSGLEVSEYTGADTIRKQLEGLQLDNNYYEKLYSKYQTHTPPRQERVMIRPDETKKQDSSGSNPGGIPDNLPLVQ